MHCKMTRDPSLTEDEKKMIQILKRNSFICSGCEKEFTPTQLYQLRCSEKCNKEIEDKINAVENKQLNRNCEGCGKSIRKASHLGSKRQFCHECQVLKRRAMAKEKAKTIPKKESNPRKKISYEELNRRLEYKRVMDDAGWDHYLRGRRWDRI